MHHTHLRSALQLHTVKPSVRKGVKECIYTRQFLATDAVKQDPWIQIPLKSVKSCLKTKNIIALNAQLMNICGAIVK